MRRSIVFTIIFLFTLFIFFTCISRFFFSFYFTTTEGDDYYHSKVTENILIFNYGQNVKSINYCFTDNDKCDDFLEYEGDFSRRIFNVKIDYPDSDEGKRICVKIVSSNSSSMHCSNETYVVDSLKPVVKSLYNDIILEKDEENLENLFEVTSNTGIKDFNCKYIEDLKEKSGVIECKAIGNNTLETVYTQTVYINDYKDLEGKKILFVGDSITEACDWLDGYGGWASRVGFDNYMDWYNIGKGGATISDVVSNRVIDQIESRSDDYFDYVIMQGGINDMHKDVELGVMTDSFDVDDFNISTYAGALEELFYYAKEYNPDAKLGFIITYQTPNSNWGDSVNDRDEWAELTRQICDKWEIPYLDLYSGLVYEDGNVKTYSEILKVDTGECFYKKDPQQVHLGSLGYDIVSKYISVWINTL